MPIGGLGWTFDTVAEDYDCCRPTYPATLYRELFAYHPARERLLAEIAEAVDSHGGVIIVRDMIDLNLARKPE